MNSKKASKNPHIYFLGLKAMDVVHLATESAPTSLDGDNLGL